MLPYINIELFDRLRSEILNTSSLLKENEEFVLACIMITPKKMFSAAGVES